MNEIMIYTMVIGLLCMIAINQTLTFFDVSKMKTAGITFVIYIILNMRMLYLITCVHKSKI